MLVNDQLGSISTKQHNFKNLVDYEVGEAKILMIRQHQISRTDLEEALKITNASGQFPAELSINGNTKDRSYWLDLYNQLTEQ